MTETQVVVVGSVNADLTTTVERYPAPGETILGSGGRFSPGGKGANQALAASRRGAAVAMVGAVGTDPQSDAALRLLREDGVDLRAVRAVEGPTGLAVITVDESGENTIVVVPGANAAVTPDDVRAQAPVIAAASVCVVQGELPASTTDAAVRVAKEAGVRVLVNLAPVVPVEPVTVAAADPLVVNEGEARGLLRLQGRTVPDAGSDPVEDAVTVCGELTAVGARSVVVTVGAAGAVFAEAGGEPEHLPAPRVDAVDTTGAGDAFVGAVAARLAGGADLRAAVAEGVRVGAYVVTGAGAQESYPREADRLP